MTTIIDRRIITNIFIQYSGICLITILAIFPIWRWYPYAQFTSGIGIFLSAGQAAGLMGAVLFAVNFILSARFPFLEILFNGQNRVYVIHHLLGSIALGLLIAHPLAIVTSYLAVNPATALRLLIPNPENMPVFFGSSSLVLIMVLLFITFYIKLPYNRWKKTHTYLGLPLFLASAHIYLIPSTTAIDPILRTYMLCLYALGIFSYSYRVIFNRVLVHKYKYKVIQISFPHPEIIDIRMAPAATPIKYTPGQFIFIDFRSLEITRETHPFTISSGNRDKYLNITVKALGDFTETIKLLRPGSDVNIEGPFGRFSYLNAIHNRQIWIAGGIGITPFLSMARSLTPEVNYRIDLYYVVKTKPELIYLTELKHISHRISKFTIHTHISQHSGRFTLGDIKTEKKSNHEYYICGPVGMMRDLRHNLTKSGIPNYLIHTEEFSIT